MESLRHRGFAPAMVKGPPTTLAAFDKTVVLAWFQNVLDAYEGYRLSLDGGDPLPAFSSAAESAQQGYDYVFPLDEVTAYLTGADTVDPMSEAGPASEVTHKSRLVEKQEAPSTLPFYSVSYKLAKGRPLEREIASGKVWG